MTPQQLERSMAELAKLIKENPANITYKNEPDYGCIEFYIDAKCITTWSYEDDPDSAFDEFKMVYYFGWKASRESLVDQIAQKYELARKAYIELTNSVAFADNGESAYVADQLIMSKFDEAFE